MAKADIRVKIEQPDILRKNILSSALDSAKILKNIPSESFCTREKQKVRKKLVQNLKEIGKTIAVFENSLPQLDEEFNQKESPRTLVKKSSKSAKKSLIEKPRNNTLQDELESIEKKLQELQ